MDNHKVGRFLGHSV